MSADFSSVADDFFLNVSLQTTLALPSGRETVLQFCEAVQKEFRRMTNFYQRESADNSMAPADRAWGSPYVLEGDHEEGSYQWMELHARNLSAGYFNPPKLDDAYHLHSWLLERSIYFLGVSALDVECLDVLYGFNLDHRGNRDAIAAKALLEGSPLAALSGYGAARAVEFEPSLVIALDEDCHLQARLSLETHSSSYQVRTGTYDDEPISIYLTIRQYPKPGETIDLKESFRRQCELGEDLVGRVIIPGVVQPIATAIATG